MVKYNPLPEGVPEGVLGRDKGYTVKYNPLPEGVLEGKALQDFSIAKSKLATTEQ